MRTYFECLPCFVNQALGALKRCGATDAQKENVMRTVFGKLAKLNFEASPPDIAKTIYRVLNKELGIRDSYAAEKKQFNEFARQILPFMRNKFLTAHDSFEAKVRLSIAANIIDFGKNVQLSEDEVEANFERAMLAPVATSMVLRLKKAISDADNILFLCDNAGEIVFDRLLIEEMPRGKITCAVRGFPVINDATLEDAQSTGLTDMVNVIVNGSDAPGTILEECSDEFRNAFNKADLVISKGQGNFETLSDYRGKKIFYLLQVKCPIVARDVGYPVGSLVVVDNAELSLNKKT